MILPGDARWIETTWTNPGPSRALDVPAARLRADPPSAFHAYRIVRQSDQALLVNGGWDQSRTREIRLWPSDTRVVAGDGLCIRAVAWHPTPVRLTVRLPWQ